MRRTLPERGVPRTTARRVSFGRPSTSRDSDDASAEPCEFVPFTRQAICLLPSAATSVYEDSPCPGITAPLRSQATIVVGAGTPENCGSRHVSVLPTAPVPLRIGLAC